MVSDGATRDSGEVATMDFPAFCAGASSPPGLVRHHAVEFDEPIGGVAMYPGDVIVGDADGVVVIPRQLAEEIADAAFEQERCD